LQTLTNFEGNELVPNKSNLFADLASQSRIIALLDRFCDRIYRHLKTGVFGHIFTSYPNLDDNVIGSLADSDYRKNKMSPRRRKIASKIEASSIVDKWTAVTDYFLSVKTRIYGIFLLFFFIYSAVASGIKYFVTDDADIFITVLPLFLSAVAIPFIRSKETFAQALISSVIGRFIVNLTGIRTDLSRKTRGKGRANAAFLLALLLGAISYFVPFYYILGGIIGIAFIPVILASPEFGLICLIFFAPILPTALLIVLAVVTLGSFILKALLAKRVFRFEALDICLVPYILMTLVGTFFGASNVSLRSGLLTILFMCSYYFAVVMLTTRKWLRRAVCAMLASCTVVSLYGFYTYLFQKTAEENEWVDQNMFSYITGRASSTFGNPNMLSVYLIVVLPIAFCAIIAYSDNIKQRIISAVAFLTCGGCLLITWTRGAWLGALVSFVILIMIWHKRSVYAFICGILAIPFLPYIIPDSMWQRLTSIGNTSDSSTAFRISILRSVYKLLPDYIVNGLGVGEDSWFVIYPKIALPGVEWTAHSHNLYLQIWVQTGLISLLMILFFFVMLFVCNFNFYKKLSDTDSSVISKITLAPLKDTDSKSDGILVSEITDTEKDILHKKTVLRLEAAAPLCGVFAVLVMGFTDYVWYNFRVYLSFWLAVGLSAAFVRVGRRELFSKNDSEKSEKSETDSSINITVSEKSENRKDME